MGLVVLAATALGVAGMIVAGAWSPRERALRDGSANLAGTLMLAVAAFAPARKLRVPPWKVLPRRRPASVLVIATGAILLDAGPRNVVVQTAVAASLVTAAVGLARRANLRHEPLLRWVAVAVVLGGFAKLDYALFPPLGPDNVHLGDVLRVVGWMALFVGVLEEMRTRWLQRAEAAVDRDAAGSPASCTTASRRSSPSSAAAPAAFAELAGGVEIVDAADRALEDSRRAIEALVPLPTSRWPSRSSASAPAWPASVAWRSRSTCACALDVADDVRAEVIRIISEAVRNAAHHGGARHVRVDLTGSPLAVRIIDDGCGFRDGANSGLGVRRLRADRDARARGAGRRAVQPGSP